MTVRLTHAWILLASETGVDPAERASCVLLVGTIGTFTESTEGISGASATEQREGREAGWGNGVGGGPEVLPVETRTLLERAPSPA